MDFIIVTEISKQNDPKADMLANSLGQTFNKVVPLHSSSISFCFPLGFLMFVSHVSLLCLTLTFVNVPKLVLCNILSIPA
uniref:Uncharacterized protein n=1 Tax=Arundo donax TaxID=35708 RepID=A0A0A9HC96_ARUDO